MGNTGSKNVFSATASFISEMESMQKIMWPKRKEKKS